MPVTTNDTIKSDLRASLALVERTQIDATVVESVLLHGDLAKLTPAQKISYYNSVCQSLGLNPLTQPFAYIKLNGKEVLYAKRDAAEQLRKVHGVSIDIKAREVIEGVYVVTAGASLPSGRRDESTGAVTIEGLKGENRANAMLKAETKAKRRATLSICGLGMLDETEVETIPRAEAVEAPAAPRPKLEPGQVYILAVQPKQYGADIAVVDADGEEMSYPVPDRQCAELCEQLVQEGCPVTLTLVKGARDGKVKVKAAHRIGFSASAHASIDEPIPVADNAALDAEVAGEGLSPF